LAGGGLTVALLAGRGARMGRRNRARLAGTSRGTRRRGDGHAGAYALLSYRCVCSWAWRLRLRRRQWLAGAGKDLPGFGRRRRDWPCRGWNGTRRRGRSGRQRQSRRRSDRWTFSHGRLDRRSASKHRRPQRNSARPVVFGLSFVFRHWFLVVGHRLWRHRKRLVLRYLRDGGRSERGSGGYSAPLEFGQPFRRPLGSRFVPPFLLMRRLMYRLVWRSHGSGFLSARFIRNKSGRVAAEITAQLQRVVVLDGTRMGQRLGDSEFVQFIDDLARLDFELPRQLIDSDLTHV
jgi:hypothetical protein